jgi:uncharacterized protein YybS (DUF2232 family)
MLPLFVGFGYFPGLLNISLLRRFIAAAKQKDNFFAGIFEVNPVPRAVMNFQFKTPIADRLNITLAAFRKTVYTSINNLFAALSLSFLCQLKNTSERLILMFKCIL